MRVVVVSHSYVVAMNQQKLEALAQRNGIVLTLIVPPAWKDMGKRISLQKWSSERYQILPVKIYLKYHLYAYFYAPWKFFIQMMRIRPHIIYVEQEPQCISAFQSAVLSRFCKSKFVFLSWENLKVKFPLWKKFLAWFVLNSADYAITGNEGAKQILQDKGYQGKIAVIPQFGIDERVFKSKKDEGLKRRLGLKSSFIIGFIARLLKEKGILTLIEAVSYLEGEYQVLIVGEGEAKTEGVELARKLQVLERLVFAGVIKHQELRDYINCLDVLVLPSLTTLYWKEQFGHVLIEAMACEVPVIGSDSGAIPEIIGDAGLIFPEGDAKELAEKISILMSDSSVRNSLRNKGRQRVLERFTTDSVVDRLFAVLKKTVG
ncbi:MAG: glycosyltransferase [Candidatus Edwardsbacteria bacterium]